jgi:hypothetical protein
VRGAKMKVGWFFGSGLVGEVWVRWCVDGCKLVRGFGGEGCVEGLVRGSVRGVWCEGLVGTVT